MIGTALLLWAVAARPFDPPRRYLKPEVALERVTACGFKHVRMTEDRDLQEDVMVISGVKSASEEQLKCVAQASLDTITYVFFPQSLDATYQRIYQKLEGATSRSQAKVWLSRRGLLDKLPIYQKGKTDNLQFSRKLERLCGLKAAGTIQVEDDALVLKFGLNSDSDLDESTVECVMNVGWASGLRVGFIGNEGLPTERK